MNTQARSQIMIILTFVLFLWFVVDIIIDTLTDEIAEVIGQSQIKSAPYLDHKTP